MRAADTPERKSRGARDDQDVPAVAGPAPRSSGTKPYRAPRLVVYGCLTEVTRFGGSQVVDSGSGLGQAL